MMGEGSSLLGELSGLLSRPWEAYAKIQGSKEYSNLQGEVFFHSLWGGTVVTALVSGLSSNWEEACRQDFYGFHIHEGNSCETGNGPQSPFPLAGGHYNPRSCPHPEHAGDLPPLLGSDGFAFLSFYTDKFVPEEIVGKTIIIHRNPDDFTTQPSGNAGEMIACGEIKSTQDN